MQVSSYQLASTSERRWQKRTVASSLFAQETTSHRFLFVGTGKERLTSVFALSEPIAHVSDLIKAGNMLDKTAREERPEIVLIDVSLNKSELSKFVSVLKSKDLFSKTLIIYNQTRLTKEDMMYLRGTDLIDDVIGFDSIDSRFNDKIAFLKKLKNRQYLLKVDRSTRKDLNFRFRGESLVKRTIDVSVSLTAILMLMPVFLCIGVAIRMESKGPVIYRSRRAGRGFRIFQFYKFRTMEINADQKISQLAHMNQYGKENGANFLKISNDPRVTKIGKFLRNTSLDELPQLFNVLKGDMSLVGNRPLPLYEASTLTTNEFAERFMAPAGITGLWQIKKRGMEDMSSEERINLDISYARRNNLAYDLWIMMHTPKALLQKSNV